MVSKKQIHEIQLKSRRIWRIQQDRDVSTSQSFESSKSHLALCQFVASLQALFISHLENKLKKKKMAEHKQKIHVHSQYEGTKSSTDVADNRTERAGKRWGERTREGVQHSTPPTLVSMATTTLERVIMQFPLFLFWKLFNLYISTVQYVGDRAFGIMLLLLQMICRNEMFLNTLPANICLTVHPAIHQRGSLSPTSNSSLSL